ncbi:hypothetical protein GOODEAATRI_025557, partial [Goodea atripinnis]
GPSGHHSWSLQFHLLPKDGQAKQVQQQLMHLQATLKTQQHIEARPQLRDHSVAMATCRPPPPVSCFQVTRLFLSHLGLLTPESVKDLGINSVQPGLLSLDSSLPGFSENLRHLDQLPSRNSDRAFVFYMRAGQRKPRESLLVLSISLQILGNVEKQTSVNDHFLDFLSSLGWPEEVGRIQVDGASRSGFLVTEMVSNCCHRRRLDSDSAPPPHVRRKNLINDIVLSYKSCCSEPAFYSALFHI